MGGHPARRPHDEHEAITEPDGTLLDGCGLRHPGRAIQYQNANVADLFIAMLKTVGIWVTK